MRAALAILVVALSTSSAAAEPDASLTQEAPRWRFGAGVSPALALLKGGGVEVDIARGRFRFFASVFTLAIPKAIQRDNKDEGWTIRDTGGGIGAEVFLRADGKGAFAGLVVPLQNHHDERMGESQDSLELAVAGEIGYRWVPWKNLYVTPRLMFVAPIYQSKERELAGEKVDEAPVRLVPLLYTGWQF